MAVGGLWANSQGESGGVSRQWAMWAAAAAAAFRLGQTVKTCLRMSTGGGGGGGCTTGKQSEHEQGLTLVHFSAQHEPF